MTAGSNWNGSNWGGVGVGVGRAMGKCAHRPTQTHAPTDTEGRGRGGEGVHSRAG